MNSSSSAMRARATAMVGAFAMAMSVLASAPASSACGDLREGATVICSLTEISGDRTAHRDVILMSPATLLPSPEGKFTGPGDRAEIVGGSDFAGVVLSRVDFTGEASGVFLGRVDPITLGFEVARAFGSIEGNQAEGFHLPEGRYRLTVITDDVPVTARVRLDGPPAGEVHIEPEEPVHSVIHRLDDSFRDQGAFVASDGRAAELTSSGLLMRAVYVIAEPHVASRLGTCAFDGSPSQGYLPGCAGEPIGTEPAVTSSFPVVSPRTDGIGIGFSSVTSTLGPGEYGQGVWYESVSMVESAGAVGLWLDLED